jgi:hypothetical protein
MPATITLPDLFSEWPFKRALNPHHESVAAASAEWVESFHALGIKAQVTLTRCKFALLASLAYPHASPLHLRAACDMNSLFFVFDELSDVKDGLAVRDLAASLVDILKYVSHSWPLYG